MTLPSGYLRALVGDGGQSGGESYVVRSPEGGDNDLGLTMGEEGSQGLNRALSDLREKLAKVIPVRSVSISSRKDRGRSSRTIPNAVNLR